MCPSDSEKDDATCACTDDNAHYDIDLNMCVCDDAGHFKQEINKALSCQPCP